MQTVISLSILEYEKDLSKQTDQITRSTAFTNILQLIESGKLYSLHIDVIRPSLIRDRSTFPIELIKQIYIEFNERIKLELHLMVKEPSLLIQKIDNFVQPNDKARISMIIQYEAYSLEEKAIKTLRILKSLGYRAGIGFDLQTPLRRFTDKVIENADLILIMCVPMGKGGQKYDERATQKIKYISKNFPGKPIKVDGGINDKTMQSARKAGANILVIGSYIANSERPLEALKILEEILNTS